MNEQNQARQTPLTDLLRAVPKDFRAQWPIQWSEDGHETGHAMCPLGRLVHEAADRIEGLEAAHARYAGGGEVESTLGFFAKYNFDRVAKTEDGRAAVWLTEDQFNAIKRLVCHSPPAQPRLPDGYIIVRDTTESLSTNKLSDKLQYWRAERPDEWTMDEFIHDAQVIEAMLSAQEPKP
jgi:hypothetical protein